MRKLAVSFVLFYIKFFAKTALFIHKPLVIGVAGSVGKSSTTNAIYAILKSESKTRKAFGNSETGVPLGILGIKIENYAASDWIKILLITPFKIFSLRGIKFLIIEMGIDDPFPPKNMEYLLSIVKPDIAISLNVYATHTMQFEKLLPSKPKGISDFNFLLKKIAEEDTKIITGSKAKTGIYNSDDKNIFDALKKYKGNLLTFGKGNSNTLIYGGFEADIIGTSFSFTTGDNEIKLNFDNILLPEVYREVFAAAILTGISLGLSLETIKQNLEKNFKLPKGRASLFAGIKEITIIDSSYNSSKSSVLSFLELLTHLKKTTNRPIAFLMGDMRELGEQAGKEHLEAAQNLEGVVDYLYCVGPLTKEYVISNLNTKKFKDIEWFDSSTKAGLYIKEHLPTQTIILVKGSQNEIFLEEAIKFLLENQKDAEKLCRQGEYWVSIKRKFTGSL